MKRIVIMTVLASILAAGCSDRRDPASVRLGYFPNLTHAQALIGMAGGRLAELTGLPIQGRLFKAGPYAIEALFAGEVDLLYVGPNPALNGYVRSKGKALHIVGGATTGGAVLVLRTALPFDGPHSLNGLRLASPGTGNTQDVALRAYLKEYGLRAEVVTVAPADMAALFQRGDLDGAWVPEPWGSRLVREAGVRIALDERELWPEGRFPTTVLVARAEFLERHPELVRRFLEAHVALTLWMLDHPAEAEQTLREALSAVLGKPLPAEMVRDALSRLEPTWDPVVPALRTMAERAVQLGYLERGTDRHGIFRLELLQEVLRLEGLSPVAESPDSP